MTAHHHAQGHAAPVAATVEISLRNCHAATDLAAVETYLRQAHGVQRVHLDRTRAVAHVVIEPQRTTLAQLRDRLHKSRLHMCVCRRRTRESGGAPAGTGRARQPWRAHGARHAARFVGSAILTVPIVLYSPLGTSLIGRELGVPFGLSRGLVGFILTSIAVWWGGWPFVFSAWRSLRRGELTMMTLIATGILVSYLSSAAVTTNTAVVGRPVEDRRSRSRDRFVARSARREQRRDFL